jgi:hypothetical protein
MPIREFVCHRKHVTEKILSATEDQRVKKIVCPHVMSSVKKIKCGEPATRIELSQTAPPILVAGSGGFHKPSVRE